MRKLTVTTRGQVTLRKEDLRHLGVDPGGKIELELLPNGRVEFKAARHEGSIQDFCGFLSGQTDKVATIEEINEAAAAGWSGKR